MRSGEHVAGRFALVSSHDRSVTSADAGAVFDGNSVVSLAT